MEKDDKLDFVSLVINLVMILASYAGYMYLKQYNPLKIDRNNSFFRTTRRKENTIVSKDLDTLPHPSVRRVIKRQGDKTGYKYKYGFNWFWDKNYGDSKPFFQMMDGFTDSKFLRAIFKGKSVLLKKSGGNYTDINSSEPFKLETFGITYEPKLYISNVESYDVFNAIDFIYMRVETVVYVYKYNHSKSEDAFHSTYELFMYIQFTDVYLANMLLSVMYPYMMAVHRNDPSF